MNVTREYNVNNQRYTTQICLKRSIYWFLTLIAATVVVGVTLGITILNKEKNETSHKMNSDNSENSINDKMHKGYYEVSGRSNINFRNNDVENIQRIFTGDTIVRSTTPIDGSNKATTVETELKKFAMPIARTKIIILNQPKTIERTIQTRSSGSNDQTITSGSTPQLTEQTTKLSGTTDQTTITSKSTAQNIVISRSTREITNTFELTDQTVTLNQTDQTAITTGLTVDNLYTIPTLNVESLNMLDNSEDTTIKPTNCNTARPQNLCSTNICKQSASKMLVLMDHSIDPCDDFYMYSCNGLILNGIQRSDEVDFIASKIDIEEKTSNYSYFNFYKEFYTSCLTYNDDHGQVEISEYLYNLYQKIETGNDVNDLTDLIAEILVINSFKSLWQLPIFDIVVDPHNHFIPALAIPSYETELNEAFEWLGYYEDYCLRMNSPVWKNEVDFKEISALYEQCHKNQTLYFGNLKVAVQQLCSKIPTLNLSDTIKKTIEKWNVLNEWRGNDLLPDSNQKKYTNFSHLEKEIPQINWQRLFTKLVPNKKVDVIQIQNEKYFERIAQFYKTNSVAEIKSILLTMVAHDFYMNFVKPNKLSNRRKFCKILAMKLVPDITSRMFMANYNSRDIEHINQTSTIIFNQIVQKLSSVFGLQTWLSDLDKNEIILKLAEIKFVGITSEIFHSDAKFEDYFQTNYNMISLKNSFISNIISLTTHQRLKMYSKINGNVDNADLIWTHFVSPISTNLHKIPSIDMLVLPPGASINLIYKNGETQQIYEDFAGIGFKIAQQLFSFFDPSHISEIISKENEIYNEFVESRLKDPEFAKTHNHFQLNLMKEEVLQTVNERFADDSALRMAFESYEQFQPNILTADLPLIWTNMTISQLFYIILGQQFCQNNNNKNQIINQLLTSKKLPNYFRINSMLMNSIHFAETFDCRDGSTMNPAFKVDQFPYIQSSEVEYIRDTNDFE